MALSPFPAELAIATPRPTTLSAGRSPGEMDATALRYAAQGLCPKGHGPMDQTSPSRMACSQCGYAFEARRPDFALS